MCRASDYHLFVNILNKRADHMIQKILIANRGEICGRINKTAKLLGIQTVAIFSEKDRGASFYENCDESYCIGPAPPPLSYLNQEAIIKLAKITKSDAIHPGYGFLSENFEFAQKCTDNKLKFIGPNSKSIHDMGIKSVSKNLMQKNNVPIIPGYFGENQNDNLLLQEAKAIGFPVLLKADYGGGGKGIRICRQENDFLSNLESVRNEATKAFGNEKIMVEKFIEQPKHIEIQVFGDQLGNHVTLFERDCSVQRRHQKILEETPAIFLGEEMREQLYTYAIKAAKAVNYYGAGTVEFMIDRAGKPYFMEMNTRLQVEHGITELITGVDLVEWQIRVANGEPLPLKQSDIKCNGHAIELRVCAEDPENDFMPCPGPLNRFIFDDSILQTNHDTKQISNISQNIGIRLDTGVKQGDEIPIYYDSMIAKLMSWAPNRTMALLKLQQALNSFYISGIKTNRDFLCQLLNHPLIGNQAKLDVDFLKTQQNYFFNQESDSLHKKDQNVKLTADESLILAKTALAHVLSQTFNNDSGDPFSNYKWFRLNSAAQRQLKLRFKNSDYHIQVQLKKPTDIEIYTDDGSTNQSFKHNFIIERNKHKIDKNALSEISIYNQDQGQSSLKFVQDNFCYIINHKGILYNIDVIDSQEQKLLHSKITGTQGGEIDNQTALSYKAPITGTIDKILIKDGDSIVSNQSLIIILAMKMEYVIKAKQDGTIEKVNFGVGDLVTKDQELLKLKAP